MRAINHGGETHKLPVQVLEEANRRRDGVKNSLQSVNQVLKDGYDVFFFFFSLFLGSLAEMI